MQEFNRSKILHFTEVMLSASIYFDWTFQDTETLILTPLNEEHNLIDQDI